MRKFFLGLLLLSSAALSAACTAQTGTGEPRPDDAAGAIGNPVDSAELLGEAPWIYGDPNAPITVVEFGDLQCEACKAASGPLKQLVDQNPDVRLVWRHFPLPMHGNAKIAAQAAEAAGAQGKFFELAALIFQNQAELEQGDKNADYFASLARQVPGLDSTKLKAALEGQTYEDQVEEDLRKGEQLGVDQTPTLYFNGVKYQGRISYDDYLATVKTLRATSPQPIPAGDYRTPQDAARPRDHDTAAPRAPGATGDDHGPAAPDNHIESDPTELEAAR